MKTPLPKSEKLMRRGIYLFLGGLVISYGTFNLARMGGGPYLLAWGPVVFGPLVFLRGLMIRGTSMDLVEQEEPEPINRGEGKCPSCRSSFTSDQDYCSTCGRFLRA